MKKFKNLDTFKTFRNINENDNIESSKIERLIDTHKNIKTIDDIKKFVHDLVTTMDLSFHPDTDFTEYVDRSHNRTFTDEQAIELNKILDNVFNIAETEGVDIYDISMDVVNDINKHINENNSSNENIVVTVYLDSPYKMGKGWTESQENQHRLKKEFYSIVSNLNLSPSETEDGVIIGEKKFDNSRLIKAYMHPSELTFTYTEYNQSDIEQMKHFVQKSLEELNIKHFPISIKEITMKDSEGKYSTVK